MLLISLTLSHIGKNHMQGDLPHEATGSNRLYGIPLCGQETFLPD